jgi:hypothetical protein
MLYFLKIAYRWCLWLANREENVIESWWKKKKKRKKYQEIEKYIFFLKEIL